MDNRHSNNFIFYIIGRLISQIGSSVRTIAIPLYILEVTGSGLMTGIFAVFSMAPTLIASPISGVLGDRWCRRKIMTYSDLIRGILLCFLGVIATMDSMSLTILFLIQVILSVLDSMFDSSSDGILPELVDVKELPKGNAARGAVDSFSMIVGPIVGGMVYGFFGIAAVFYTNGVTFLISSLLVSLIVYKKNVRTNEKLAINIFVSDIKETFKFIFSTKGLKHLFLFAMISNFLLMPIFIIIMPYAFTNYIGFTSQQYGFLQTSQMIGLLIGNIVLGGIFNRFSQKKMMKLGMLLQSVTVLFFTVILFPPFGEIFQGASWNYFIIIGLSIVLIGLVNPLVNIPIQTSLQKLVADEMRSRFFSVLNLMSQLIVPLSSLIFGAVLEIIPVYFILIGIAFLLTVAVILFVLTAPEQVYNPTNFEHESSSMTEEKVT